MCLCICVCVCAFRSHIKLITNNITHDNTCLQIHVTFSIVMAFIQALCLPTEIDIVARKTYMYNVPHIHTQTHRGEWSHYSDWFDFDTEFPME